MTLNQITKIKGLGIHTQANIVSNSISLGGIATASNFKTGTSNLHNVGLEIAGINVLGADTPIGTGATIYDAGGAVFTGVVTATSFSGALTGTSSGNPTLANGVDNRIVTATGANTLNGEANLTFNGNNLQFNTTANGHAVILKSTGNYYNKLSFDSGNTSAGGELAYIDFSWDGDKVADIQALAGSDAGNKDDGHLVFRTSASQGSITERLRITSGGYVGINTDASGNGSGAKLVVGGRIQSNAGGYWFAGANGAEDGWHVQDSGGNLVVVESGVEERLRITSSGNIAINSAGTATNLLDVRKDATSVKTHVGTINGQLGSMPNSSEYGISLVGGNGEFQLHKDGSGNYQLVLGTYQGSIDMPLVFRTDNRQERMRITKAGKLVVSTNTATTAEFDYAGVYFTSDNSTVAEGLFINNVGSGTGGNASISFSGDSGNRKKSAISHVRNGNYGRGDLTFSIDPDADSGHLDVTAHEKLRITSTGKVGINESNPGAQLVVKATSDDNPSIQLYRQSTGGDIASIYWQTGSGTQAKINYRGAAGASEGLQFYTAGGSSSQLRMIIDHSGKVGINRNDPAEMLDVYGTIQCSGAGLKIDTHPLVSYASFADISGGAYAARLGSTGTSTIRSTQIYGGGGHIATFDGVNKRLGINVTDPDSALELRSSTASYTPVIKLSNHHSGAWGGAITFESNHNGTIWETASIHGYGGMGSSDGILAIKTRGTERFRCNHKGQTVVTPSGNAGSASGTASLSLVQTGNYGGVYPGISIKSLSTGGNGMSVFCFDHNWDLYTRSGNQTGLGFLTDTEANSANARMVIGADGKVCLGTEVYGNLSTSRDSYTALHIAGGALSIGPKGNNSATRQGGRYVLGWYMMSAYTGHSYIHVVTDLFGGSGNNYDYIMGGFHIHGHAYQSGNGQSEERIYFHNWGGTMHGYSRGHWGAWDPGNAAYINSNGFVTIRLLAGNYRGYIIDLVQHAWYGIRNINVTAHTGSNSSTI